MNADGKVVSYNSIIFNKIQLQLSINCHNAGRWVSEKWWWKL